MKYIKWFGIAIGTLVLVTICALVLANFSDEKLNPAAEPIINSPLPVTEQGTKAFYYLLGVRTGETVDPESVGRELWSQAIARRAANESDFFMGRLKTDVWHSFPISFKSVPSSKDWTEREEVRTAFEGAQSALDQYVHLLSFGEMSPLISKDFFISSALSPQMLLQGHRWLCVYLGKLVAEKKWPEAERLVQQEVHFEKSLIKSQTLLMTMIAAVVIHDDAVFLDQEIKLNPKLHARAETIRELSLPPSKEIIDGALKTELRYFSSLMPVLLHQNYSQILAENLPPFARYGLASWLLLPNQSINKYYEFIGEATTKSCVDDNCFESFAWAHPSFPLAWLRNPLGRTVFNMFTVSISGRFAKLEQRQKELAEIVGRLK